MSRLGCIDVFIPMYTFEELNLHRHRVGVQSGIRDQSYMKPPRTSVALPQKPQAAIRTNWEEFSTTSRRTPNEKITLLPENDAAPRPLHPYAISHPESPSAPPSATPGYSALSPTPGYLASSATRAFPASTDYPPIASAGAAPPNISP